MVFWLVLGFAGGTFVGVKFKDQVLGLVTKVTHLFKKKKVK
jgi:hypothetical protein